MILKMYTGAGCHEILPGTFPMLSAGNICAVYFISLGLRSSLVHIAG